MRLGPERGHLQFRMARLDLARGNDEWTPEEVPSEFNDDQDDLFPCD